MSRIERRLARKRGGTSSGASPGTGQGANTEAQFAVALEAFRNGAVGTASDLGKAILVRDPNHAQTLNLLGIIAQQAGRNRAAVKLIGQAIAQDPSEAPFHYNIGLAYQALGDRAAALSHYENAISLSLKDETALINDNSFVIRCLQRIEAAWPRRLTLTELFGEEGIDAFVADNLLLLCLLQFGYAHDDLLERLLTELRFAVLREAAQSAGTSALSEDALIFLSAFAQQCFRNGYVFAVSESELDHVRALCDRLGEELSRDGDLDALALITVAAYLPLHSLPFADAIAARSWPEYLATLIAVQIREPREEAEIRKKIRALTIIGEGVSREVQQQYEESPFPAWSRLAPVTPVARFDQYLSARLLRNDLPQLPVDTIKKALVAGCGTGRHALVVARAFPQTHVLALDISRTSLGYAVRKTRELGIANVEYAHADITELGAINRMFELIESIGVLHHLADPAAGLRRLLSLLRPGGIIGVGLYSERARRAIVAARSFIAGQGYRPVIEDIRAARQELIRRSRAIPSESVIVFRDFFDASGCRDLLFNVMEHRFTIPQIKSLLAENSLNFLGFEISPRTRAQFLAQFPGEDSLLDLDKWDVFEAAHPESFVGMYVFYAQKIAAAPNSA